MVHDPPPQQGKRHWTVVSVALFVVGLLILAPSALCTLFVGSLFVTEPGDADASNVGVVLIFGGVPMVLGAVLVWAGLKARRRD